jgi:hypothetical protein
MPGYQQYDMPAYQQYDMPAYQAPQPILKPPMPGYQAYEQPGYQAYSPQHSAMPPQVSPLPGLACPGLAVLMPLYINGVSEVSLYYLLALGLQSRWRFS